MPEPDLRSLRARLWAESRLVRETVERDGIASYARSLSNLSDAFRPGDRGLRCIDGRTPGGVRLAGSGILMGLQKARAFAEAAGADRVTFHEDCGAARLWATENSRDVTEATACAREFAQQLADALGVPCAETPLVGPSGFHDETVIYYDGTGLANPSRVSGLPKGFVVSRPYFGDDFVAALDQVQLAVQLALSDIGFADLFTPEHPLRLVAIGHPETGKIACPTVEQLTQELGLLDLPPGNRVVIDGFAYGSGK